MQLHGKTYSIRQYHAAGIIGIHAHAGWSYCIHAAPARMGCMSAWAHTPALRAAATAGTEASHGVVAWLQLALWLQPLQCHLSTWKACHTVANGVSPGSYSQLLAATAAAHV